MIDSISFSKLQLYDQCPFKFYQSYLLKNREPATIHMEKGSALHYAMEQAYKQQNFDLLFLTKTFIESFDKRVYKFDTREINKSIEDGRSDLIKIHKFILKNKLNRKPILIEQKYSRNYRGMELKVVIDLMIEWKGKLLILDWKFGQRKHNHKYQVGLYGGVVAREFPEKEIVGALIYGDKPTLKPFEFTQEFRKECSDYISNIFNRLINDKEFKPKQCPGCFKCYLTSKCPLQNNFILP